MEKRRINYDDWMKEGQDRFGHDVRQWQFKCPCCGYVARLQDWYELEAHGMAAFSCLGRALPPEQRAPDNGGPCDYAGGRLFQFNPVIVCCSDGKEVEVFEFAD